MLPGLPYRRDHPALNCLLPLPPRRPARREPPSAALDHRVALTAENTQR